MTGKRVTRKPTCSDTIEESSSDVTVFRRKHTRHPGHICRYTCRLSHAHIKDACEWCSRTLWHGVFSDCHVSSRLSLRFKLRRVRVSLSADNLHSSRRCWCHTLRSPLTGGTQECAWVRRKIQGQLDTKETSLLKSLPPRRSRRNEAGELVQGSHGYVTRGVENLQLTETTASQHARTATAPPPKTHSTTIKTPTRPPSLCSMRFQQRNLTLEVQIQVLWGIKHGGHPLVTGKCCSAPTTGSGSMCVLWHHSIAASELLQSLQRGHCDSEHPSG